MRDEPQPLAAGIAQETAADAEGADAGTGGLRAAVGGAARAFGGRADAAVRDAARRRLPTRLAPRAIGELELELSWALMAQGRVEPARAAFSAALAEGVDRIGMLRNVATAARSEGATDVAVRALLELAAHRPDDAETWLAEAAMLLDPTAVSAHTTWILDEWYPAIRDSGADTKVRMEAALFACRVALLSADPKAAKQALSDARRFGPELVSQGTDFLRQDSLAPRLRADPVAAQALLAELYAVAGRHEQSLDCISSALSTNALHLDYERRLTELRAEQLEQLGRDDVASRAHVEAGRLHDLATHHMQAIDHFQQATRLDNSNARAYWYLADSLRFAAELAEYPYVDPDTLEQALAAWQTGMRWERPRPGQGWVHLTGALIHELLARLADEPDELIHAATLQAEQAAALDPESGDAWALLCRYHRVLRHVDVTRHAARYATDRDDRNPNANFERAVTAVLMAEPGAQDLLTAYERGFMRGRDAVVLGLRGYALMLEGGLDEACEYLVASLDADPSDIWIRTRLALCAALSGDEAGTREAAERVWRETGPGTTRTGLTHSDVRALAALFTRRDDEAETALEAGMNAVGNCPVELRMASAVVSQLRGEPAAARGHAAAAVREIRHRGEARVAHLYLELLERWHPNAARRSQRAWAEVWEQLDACGKEHAEVARPSSGRAIEELAAAAAGTEPPTALWLLTRCGQARILAAEGNWDDALSIDESLLSFDDPVRGSPAVRHRIGWVLHHAIAEATAAHDLDAVRRWTTQRIALVQTTDTEEALTIAAAERSAGNLDKALDEAARAAELAAGRDRRWLRRALMLQGEILLERGTGADAQERFEQALAETTEDPEEAMDRAAIEVRIAVLAAQRGAIGGSLEALKAAVAALAGSNGIAAAARTIQRQCGELVERYGEPHALSAAFRAFMEEDDLGGPGRRGVAAARFAMRRRLNVGSREPKPRVDQITVQGGIGVFPEGVEDESAKRLRDSSPGMRERILSATGIRIPAVAVRPNDLLDPPQFRILINEVPYAFGSVPAGTRLRPADDADATAAWVRNAWTGQTAVWSEGEGLDAPIGIAWLLEGLLRTNLAQFVSLAEVEHLLDVWQAGGGSERAALLGRAIPGRRARTRFVAVVNRLVREQVPVHQLKPILEAVAEATVEFDRRFPIGVLGEAVRARLVDVLPGSAGDREVLVLPRDLEDALRTAARPMPRGLALSIRGRLCEIIGARAPGEFVLVVRERGIRVPVQNLAERVLPSVAVLSAQEAHEAGVMERA